LTVIPPPACRTGRRGVLRLGRAVHAEDQQAVAGAAEPALHAGALAVAAIFVIADLAAAAAAGQQPDGRDGEQNVSCAWVHGGGT
jgi:hypothetical protein